MGRALKRVLGGAIDPNFSAVGAWMLYCEPGELTARGFRFRLLLPRGSATTQPLSSQPIMDVGVSKGPPKSVRAGKAFR